jgi:hypothetical protein
MQPERVRSVQDAVRGLLSDQKQAFVEFREMVY